MKEKLPFIIIGTLITALSIAGFIAGAYLVAAIMFCGFVLAPAIIILLPVLIVLIFDRYPIKTINSFVVFWFLIVFLIGATGGSMLIIGGVSNGYVVLMLVFGGIFALIGIGGIIGLIINISSHIRIVKVFKRGTEAVGTYLDYDGGYSTTGSTRYGRTSTQNWYSVKFKYNNGTQIVEGKTNAVYSQKEAKWLAEKNAFAIKYLGNRAIITEQIELKKPIEQLE